ncbi:hypothetical protein HYDPIDRAFT_119976 [Hydnomerulius pinastri MD-312]|uniref:Uncharacterized protein n=1 Tax=Hydnomerulius pinastri MD-312 TaxID=994086 RepID=A0A0C9UYK6_9AGAM|nr:hypothetical protein HYDPIDRAFT_119976 [Hydnomerulius pinastri MD-312]
MEYNDGSYQETQSTFPPSSTDVPYCHDSSHNIPLATSWSNLVRPGLHPQAHSSSHTWPMNLCSGTDEPQSSSPDPATNHFGRTPDTRGAGHHEIVPTSVPTSLAMVHGLATGPRNALPTIMIEGELDVSVDASNPRTCEVLRDDLNFVALNCSQIGDRDTLRVHFVLAVLAWAMVVDVVHKIYSCPRVIDLCLRMIEGDDSGDDIWLWADGDEEWMQEHCYKGYPFYGSGLEQKGLADAQGALRRRLDREQRISQPPTTRNANPNLQDKSSSARIRNADPAQRIAVIAWLILSSEHRDEMLLQHGYTSQQNFGSASLIGDWHVIVYETLRLSPSFPEQPEEWKKFEEKRNAIGCKCLDPGSCYVADLRDWFRMIVWLRGEEPLVECIDWRGCGVCKPSCTTRTTLCILQRSHRLHPTFSSCSATAVVSRSARPETWKRIDAQLRNSWDHDETDL